MRALQRGRRLGLLAPGARRARVSGSVACALTLALATGVASAAVVAVAPGPGALVAALDAATPGDVIELGRGVFAGPVQIDKALILRGRGAVIDGGDLGTVVRVTAPGARLEGLTVRRSGTDIGAPDACIFVDQAATGAVLLDNTLEDCAFGIWVHRTDGARLVGNSVRGRDGIRQSDRGNGIHLFDASNVVVRDNRVSEVRDGIYVSATEGSTIEGNQAHAVRFGVHYMYSWDNQILANATTASVVGIALMESRNLVVEENHAADNVRQGLLFRDIQDTVIRRNLLERNGTGMFFFSSIDNVIEDNVVLDNDIGMKIWAGTKDNRVEGNVIRGNREQIFYVASEDQEWGGSGRGNRWGDYLGWDQDGDGIGDRPHRVDSFTAGLLHQYPSAVLLLRSPALETLAHLADRLPMLRTPTIIDVAPLLGDAQSQPSHARASAGEAQRLPNEAQPFADETQPPSTNASTRPGEAIQ